MDMTTLAMAEPKIVDMREFSVGHGTDFSFNNAILQLVQTSMQKGGGWITAPCYDPELALSKALSKNHNPILYVYEPSQQGECYVPLATVLVGGSCNVASASVPCFMASIPITLDIMIVWAVGGVDEEVNLYIKAAPFTATPVGD